MTGPVCMRPDCDEPATRALRDKYQRRPWHACEDHWSAMHDALFIGQPSDSGQVHMTRLGSALLTAAAVMSWALLYGALAALLLLSSFSDGTLR